MEKKKKKKKKGTHFIELSWTRTSSSAKKIRNSEIIVGEKKKSSIGKKQKN